MSGRLGNGRWLKTGATIGVLAITAGSWWLSFTALVRAAGLIGLSDPKGGPTFDAVVWAGLIDAFVGLGTVCLVVYRQESRKPVYPTLLLAIFGTATVAWNAALAPTSAHVPDLVVRIGWGMPPAAMFLAWHQLINLLWPHQRIAPVPEPVPPSPRRDDDPVKEGDSTAPEPTPLQDVEPVPDPAGRNVPPLKPARARASASAGGAQASRNRSGTKPPGRNRKVGATGDPGRNSDDATRARAFGLIDQADRDGQKPTGSGIGTALGVSDSLGRRYIREFRAEQAEQEAPLRLVK